VVAPGPPPELRFAGPVEAGHPYRADDVFRCRKGHRRVEVGCTCGFYAVADPTELKASVVRTVLLEVSLEGRVVRHRECVRGERQRVRRIVVDGWCAFCVRPAVGLAAIPPLFGELPAPWHRAVPVCEGERATAVIPADEVAARLCADQVGPGGRPAAIEVVWDRSGESPAAASLRRLTRARRGATW
jgi:hypothetical protein